MHFSEWVSKAHGITVSGESVRYKARVIWDIMWVKQCHEPSPKSPFLSGTNHSSHGWFMALLYPHYWVYDFYIIRSCVWEYNGLYKPTIMMICLSENGGLTQMAISIGKIVMNDWIEWATVIFRQSYLN